VDLLSWRRLQPDLPRLSDRLQQLPQCNHTRANEWVVRGLRDESGSDRISNDVPRDDERRFIAAQYAFEAVSLPQLLFLVLPRVVEARVLLCTKNKPRAIRIVGCALNQQMNMIWHEAVRENLKAFFSSSAQKLPQSESTTSCFTKRCFRSKVQNLMEYRCVPM